ncbi:MAG: hypothetical protein ACRDBX_00135 [Erysipelotrichaceae bacterium]
MMDKTNPKRTIFFFYGIIAIQAISYFFLPAQVGMQVGLDGTFTYTVPKLLFTVAMPALFALVIYVDRKSKHADEFKLQLTLGILTMVTLFMIAANLGI